MQKSGGLSTSTSEYQPNSSTDQLGELGIPFKTAAGIGTDVTEQKHTINSAYKAAKEAEY